MSEHIVRFSVISKTEVSLPDNLLRAGGKYAIEHKDGDIIVWGNTQGLLYLAEVFVRMAKGSYNEGVHVHLKASTLSTDGDLKEASVKPEVIVFAATDNLGTGRDSSA